MFSRVQGGEVNPSPLFCLLAENRPFLLKNS